MVEVYLNDVLVGGFKFTEGTEMANFNGLKSLKLSISDVLRVEMELAWNRPNISKDFSLQAWSTETPVSILHTNDH